MVRPMFGVESEYAVASIGGRPPIRREDLVGRYLRVAGRRLRHLQDMGASSGMFLENGSRFYIDCGLHPELTTPETTNPFDLARYIKAGERILEGITQEVQAEAGPSTEIACFRCNVDYSGSGSTWGCHESYLHRADPSNMPEQTIPHLVTRVIYTGAGGFNPLVSQLEFCVAPRLMHMQQTVSHDSTSNRGIFHTKNESLSADGYNRLHIICGESLYSETAIALKIGATALVVAMAEEGLQPGAGLRLASPLDALHAIASDVTCKRKLRLAEGGEATAIEIQRRLLRLAERNRSLLPNWAGPICALWRLTLDRLESAPESLATVLDWTIKRRLFDDRSARGGIPAGRFPFLNSILQRLNAALAGVNVNGREIRLSAAVGPQSPIPEEAAKLEAALAKEKLGWSDLDRFLNLRDEFFQIDNRFGQLGPRGIFSELDRRGVLDHKAPAIDGIEAAMREPPAVGRAKLRGEMVRRLSGQAQAACGWMCVTAPDGRTLDLSDPFAAAELWDEPPAPQPETEELPPDLQEELFADSSRFQQMLETMRRRYGRPRTRPQGPPEAAQGPNR